MRKLKTLLIAMLVVPCVILLAACGGNGDQGGIPNGTYGIQELYFDGTKVNVPSLPSDDSQIPAWFGSFYDAIIAAGADATAAAAINNEVGILYSGNARIKISGDKMEFLLNMGLDASSGNITYSVDEDGKLVYTQPSGVFADFFTTGALYHEDGKIVYEFDVSGDKAVRLVFGK